MASESKKSEFHQVVIVGSGPAAFTTAITLLTNGMTDVKMYAGKLSNGMTPGGQLTTTTVVDNYPGFQTGTLGPDLMDRIELQVEELGLKTVNDNIVSIDLSRRKDYKFVLEAGDGNLIYSKAVALATGASARKLEVDGSREYWQRGISACAVCDGFLYKDKVCAVIGGGDTAFEECIYLSNICSKVYSIHRSNKYRARDDHVKKAKNIKNIEFITNAVLDKCIGDKQNLHSIECIKDGKALTIELDGLFFAIGHNPNSLTVERLGIDMYENGYVKTDLKMRTSMEGLFACGDIQDYTYRQAVTASSSGAVAALGIIKYLEK